MKQFNRRQLRDDRLLKSMARNDQLKADLNNSELSELHSRNEFGTRATLSQSRFATIQDRSLGTDEILGWSDSSELP